MRVAAPDDSGSSSDSDIANSSAIKARRSILRFDTSHDPFVSGSASFSVIDLHTRSMGPQNTLASNHSSSEATTKPLLDDSVMIQEIDTALHKLSVTKDLNDALRDKLLADAETSVKSDDDKWSARILALEAARKAKLEQERLEQELKRQEQLAAARELEKQREAAEQKRAALVEADRKKLEAERQKEQELKKAAEEKKAQELAAENERKEKARLAAEAREKAATASKKAPAPAKVTEPVKSAAPAAATSASLQAPQTSKASQTISTGNPNSSAVQNEYKEHMAIIAKLKNEINPGVQSNSAYRSACFNLKLKLKPKFGQLTNSVSQLKTILNAVKEILHSAQQQGDLVLTWTLNIFAKQLLQQAESESNVAVEAAVPLAMLTVLIWVEFPQLGPLLLARFVKKCPHVIGYVTDVSTEQGRKTMGYRRGDDGKWEADNRYNERMSGIVAVWSAMTQTKLSAAGGKKHPYTMMHSWVFVARHLNRPVAELSETDYCVLASWWDVTAMRFVGAYGRQAEKMLRLASNEWISASKLSNHPSANRLRLLGQDWQRSGKLVTAWKPMTA